MVLILYNSIVDQAQLWRLHNKSFGLSFGHRIGFTVLYFGFPKKENLVTLNRATSYLLRPWHGAQTPDLKWSSKTSEKNASEPEIAAWIRTHNLMNTKQYLRVWRCGFWEAYWEYQGNDNINTNVLTTSGSVGCSPKS